MLKLLGFLLVGLLNIHGLECAAHWNEESFGSLTRIRRRTERCRTDEFNCNNGLCIKDELECDGKEDCKDGSDETSACSGHICLADFGFKCAYGACIPKKGKCNGIKECRDNSDESDCPNKPVKPTATRTCGRDQFTCQSGDCIGDEKWCDGRADCPDSSDETANECLGRSCVGLFAFTCNYGACIPKSGRCNGIKDCLDGSDEIGCENHPEPGSCVVPSVLTNGIFVNPMKPAGTLKLGDSVPNYYPLITVCNKNYKTTSPNKNFPICINGTWTRFPYGCARHCSSAISTKTKKITCTFDQIPLESCEDPVDGTIAKVRCEPFYESQAEKRIRLCRDGTWDYPITECQPVCGLKPASSVKPHLMEGKSVMQTRYPWHVGIYANDLHKTHICGGSIINQKVIVSAAHCFTNADGDLYPKENYLIAAGKNYRLYDDKRDESTAQYASIKRIHKPNRYKGSIGNYEADIVVVVLTAPLVITHAVLPVCVDWDNTFEDQQLVEKSLGVVVGWGLTAQGNAPSLDLKEMAVPYIPNEQCLKQVAADFRRFVTYDKMCGGFTSADNAVREGDGGGGLTFRQKLGPEDRYYLRGVASTAASDTKQFATYTLISKHVAFIKEIEAANRI